MSLAENVYEARRKAKLSQEKLAQRCDLSRQTIVDIEHGVVTNPGLETLTAIADVLGLSLDDLVGREVARIGGPPKDPRRPVVQGSGAAALEEPEPEDHGDDQPGREDEAVAHLTDRERGLSAPQPYPQMTPYTERPAA